MRKIGLWLADVKRDLETPDLWAELQQEAELLGKVTDEVSENTPFTLNEQKEIARRLKELAETTKRTHSLSAQQMRVLDTKLSYLINAASRLGRIDWRNAFVGAIIGFILTTALPPETARYIFVSVLQEIIKIYVILPKLPSG